ncbi:hypothetical protein C2I06_15715 [Niallia circulans]|nr:hypothetical protein C2I06_15715 [Niallia circulans]
MDLIDKKIIDELNQSSRLSMSELGRRINLFSPSVTERDNLLFTYCPFPCRIDLFNISTVCNNNRSNQIVSFFSIFFPIKF